MVIPNLSLNSRAHVLVTEALDRVDELGIESKRIPNEEEGGWVLDFNSGGLDAGLILARICMADYGTVSREFNRFQGVSWPYISVHTDNPMALMLSQFAGWSVVLGDYFGMGSGPARVVNPREKLITDLGYSETPDKTVLVLEAYNLPTVEVLERITEKTGIEQRYVYVCVARTRSFAGTVQVVARSAETALHKLHELEFDLRKVKSVSGTAPLPPVASDDLTGLGRTNDAVLYGSTIHIWVDDIDDAELAQIGPTVPASSSKDYGEPFRAIFEKYDRDFYQIDPMLFSPGVIVFHNLSTGNVHQFGQLNDDVLAKSFGLN